MKFGIHNSIVRSLVGTLYYIKGVIFFHQMFFAVRWWVKLILENCMHKAWDFFPSNMEWFVMQHEIKKFSNANIFLVIVYHSLCMQMQSSFMDIWYRNLILYQNLSASKYLFLWDSIFCPWKKQENKTEDAMANTIVWITFWILL